MSKNPEPSYCTRKWSSSRHPEIISLYRVIQGRINHRVFSSASVGITDSNLPEGVTITPILMNVGADACPVTVKVSNLTVRPIIVEPSHAICQIQYCAIETELPSEMLSAKLHPALKLINLDESKLSDSERDDVWKHLSDRTDIFSASWSPL